ncbi:hypothetical protein [Enterococcus sp. 2201sp1_2201st1_B8_2201SCRN_220225]|uniref:baeRF6 domain-containing protein n=1 Tax=unclassified Enterococcus TaxID=2608891 RepID=UPI0034A5C9BE
MTKVGKELLAELTGADTLGPFVSIMLNTHVAHQDVEKDQIKFKNFAKEAKKRFEKKYPAEDWNNYQTKIETLLADQSFWRSGSTSVAVFLTAQNTWIHRLQIPIDDQYYVGDTPYVLGAIRNAQFNYTYYLLALNRDSMELYFVDNGQINKVDLPKGAPVDVPTALGEEITGGNLNFRSQGGQNGGQEAAYHGVNAKDEEVEIDWKNYYQAVDTFLREELENEAGYPLYLFALPENQTMFKKYAKAPFFSTDANIPSSPATLSNGELNKIIPEIAQQLADKEIAAYQNLLDKKFMDQLVDILPASKEGRVANLFIATSNLIDGYGEDPDAEYDRRQVLNTLVINTLKNGGEAHILDQKDAPDEKSLTAILRY